MLRIIERLDIGLTNFEGDFIRYTPQSLNKVDTPNT